MAIDPQGSYATQSAAAPDRPFFGNAWEGFGFFTSVTGTLLGALGNYYSTKSQQHELKSRALDAEFAASMANLNARAAEDDAQAEIEAGQDEKARLTAQYGQAKSDARASAAARGVGGASVAEQLASIELAKEVDSLTITRNSVRAANRRRAEAVNYRNQGALGRVSANNLRGTAGSLSPYANAGAGLLSGAGQLASNWAPRYRSSY